MKDWNWKSSAKTEDADDPKTGVRYAAVCLCVILFILIVISGCSLSEEKEYFKESTAEAMDYVKSLFGIEDEEAPEPAELPPQTVKLPSPVNIPGSTPEDPWSRFEVGSGSVGSYSYYESDIETIEEDEEEPEEPEKSEEEIKGASYQFSQESNYCFSTMNSDEKRIYKEIFNCFLQMSENIELSTLDTELVDKCFNYVMLDHPEIFYVDGYKISLTKRGDVPVRLGITGKYNVTRVERGVRQKKIEEKVNEILAAAPMDADEYSRVKYAYDYIVANTDYDTTAPDNQNIVSVFLTGRSVCQGYSMAMKYLLDRMDIMCTIVYGSANNENHSWNMVRIDGINCFVDATWGDASYREETGAENNIKINYNYFGVNDHILLRTHRILTPAPVPECVSLEKYYYVVEGKYFTEMDMDQLSECFEKTRSNGEKFLTIKCADRETYDTMLTELFDEHKIFEFYDTTTRMEYVRDNTEFTFTFSV